MTSTVWILTSAWSAGRFTSSDSTRPSLMLMAMSLCSRPAPSTRAVYQQHEIRPWATSRH